MLFPRHARDLNPRGLSLLTKIFILVIMRLPLISSESLFLGFKIHAFSKEVLTTQTADFGHLFSGCRAEVPLSGVVRDLRDGK